MRTGDLRERVTFQKKSVTRNTVNEEVVTWVDVVTVWAQIEPLVGREFLDQRQMASQITTRIRIRYRPNINNLMRAKWGERIYEIDSVVTVQERRRETVVMCSEGTTPASA